MSHRPRGGGPGQPYQPHSDQEWHQYHRCRELGMQYPPDPVQVYAFIQLLKKDGEYALNNNNFVGALSLYTRALRSFELFPKLPHIAEEHHKLLCNRSLVFLKMRKYKEAERDAIDAIASCPTFIKGYWRASQAVKGGYNGVQKALPYIVEGLRLAVSGEGNTHDIVTFLTEVCILVPRATVNDEMMRLLMNQLVIPYGEEVYEIWNKVIQKLASQSNWQSLAMLLTGYNEGVSCALEDQDTATWNWSSVNVGSLLAYVSDDSFIKWGEELAVQLIEFGSDLEEIGKRFGCPSLHHVVKLSLRLGSINLLRCILEKYRHSHDKINSVDGDGSTALHIVVRSGIELIDNKLVVLDLLLVYKCNAALMDRFNKKPIDYAHQNDSLYKKLQTSSRSVEELRQDLDALKSQGNTALKAGKHSEALRKYDEALAISQKSDQLYKEAAVLYSNRANVLFTLQNYTDALANALAAVSCDSSWHKGHWWKAKTLLTMGSAHDAFGAYMDGYIQSEVSGDVKLNFLIEAVTQLTHVTSEHFMNCYNQLRFLDRRIWPAVLSKLSRNVEWKCMAYLILGTNLDGQRLGSKVDRTGMVFLCTGVAGSCDTVEVQTNTIFQYLRKRDCNPKLDGPWLDAVLFAVYIHGNAETLKCLAVDDTDCPLHAAVRFAFLTGRDSFVEELASSGRQFLEQMAVNPVGDSVFHFISKFRPPPEIGILTKIMDILLKKGMSVNVKDARGKRPVEYLDKSCPRSVFGMFAPPSTSHSVDDINRLKEEGNVMFKNGAVTDAVDMYSKAIDILMSSEAKTIHAKLTKHEMAVLFGNRAEAYLKLQQYQRALDDAMQSVTFDCKWYKTHLRVGKAMRGLQRMEGAKAAYINAYCNINTNVEDKVKVNILIDLASVCSEMPKSVWNVQRMIKGLPNDQGHLWALACYELASNNYWKKAAIAYYQFSKTTSKILHLKWTLKPFSDLNMLKEHPWAVDIMLYFLNCGCNRKTISVDHGDTYLHAVIRISLVVGNLSMLEYLVEQYCRHGNTDQHKLDINNNSILHTATKEKEVDKKKRYDVIVLLLGCNVNPNLKNASGQFAIDYLSKKETQSREVLRMAMYSKENVFKLPSSQQSNKKTHQRVSSSNSKSSESTSVMKPKRSCDICNCLYSQGLSYFRDGKTEEGYEKMVELLKISHKGSHHEEICEKAVTEIAKKVAETQNPEIPPCLMSIGRETFIMIIDGLANSNKWRQLDMLVRKFRQVHGSDQLKGFASNMSVVPVVKDTSLKAAEELKFQIVINLLNGGASLGTDNGEMAVKCAVIEEHFKVLTELVKRGADTTKLSIYDGDTPIHAAMVIVLEKEKSPVLLEFLLSQFDSSHDACPHLDPEQLDKNGDCLFHLIARAKFSTYVLKLTEMLCSKNLSANYYNKEGKLPINYIIKTNDRRLQYLRLASSVAPSREQLHGPHVPVKEESTASLDEDLNQIQGPSSDSVTNQKVVIEVTRTVSIRETRKKHIEELIRLLPDSKHSIFKVDQSPSSNIVIASENKDNHSGEDNMDEDSQKTKAYAKNSDAGTSDRSYLDSQSSKTDTQSSKFKKVKI